MNSTEIDTTLKTPEKSRIKFPLGHALVNARWRNNLGKEIAKKVNVTYSDALGFVDVYVSEDHPVMYISESDMSLKKKECRDRLSKMNSTYNGKGTVILTRNSKTILEYNDLQEFAVLDLGLFVFPITCHIELPTIIYKMVMNELKSPVKSKKGYNSNPKLSDQISVLTNIPSIGNEKAKILLERFGNIICISEATSQALAKAIGEKAGKQVFTFFHQPLSFDRG